MVPHPFINVENFMLYETQHNYILNQQEAKPKWITLNLVLNDTKVKDAAINANSKDATNEPNKTLKKLEDPHG